MRSFAKKKLGDLLVESGLITMNQLDEALGLQKQTGKKIGEILIDKGYITRKSICEVLEYQMGIPYVDLALLRVEPQIARIIPENMARKHEIVSIKLENNVLTVAASDPLNSIAFDDVRIFTGYEVQPVMADLEQIRALISAHFGSQKAAEAVEEFNKTNSSFVKDKNVFSSETDSFQDVGDSPAVKLIAILIEQACQSGASDIHIEPQNRFVRIRFRIDGQLRDIMSPDIEILPSIVSRIKVMAGLNIAEKRLPQDGRISYMVDGKEADLRISILPAIHGEKVVIRVINKDTFDFPKEKLGFLPENLQLFNSVLKNPHGVLLVTGPTGSGKTTTLYTAVKELNTPDVNIVTVEDPVESPIEGITQVAVNVKAGLDFAGSLRSILRQDPDIILIGEIRDSETAEIAIRSAITGHLVLSTLHTNDAPSSIIRLIDMGIQPFLAASSLVGVIAQRLVRRICPNCSTAYIPSDDEKEFLNLDKNDCTTKLYKGRGCELCRGTGYKGRLAVHEVMKVGSEIRQAIYNGESSDVLRDIAVKNGMITIRENTKRLVLKGITTFDEMLRISYSEE